MRTPPTSRADDAPRWPFFRLAIPVGPERGSAAGIGPTFMFGAPAVPVLVCGDDPLQVAFEAATVVAGAVQHVPRVLRVSPVLMRVKTALHHLVRRPRDLGGGSRVAVAQ